jgi:hypothetical protein
MCKWKCNYTKRCTRKRWGIGEPHWNCIHKGFCAYQFYVCAGIIEKKKEKKENIFKYLLDNKGEYTKAQIGVILGYKTSSGTFNRHFLPQTKQPHKT